MEDFLVREYREGDEAELNRLFNEVFGAARSLDEWRWKFRENPTNAMAIAVAESGGCIVGQYANLIAFFKYLDRVVPVSLPVDNLVVRRFRGGMNGVLKALHALQSRLWSRPLMCGFPTRAHFIASRRILKYGDLGMMPVLAMRLNFRLAVRNRVPWIPPRMLAAIRSVSNFGFRTFIGIRSCRTASAIRTRMVDSFDARIDALWERAGTQHKIVCVRDRRYLDWRYSKPGASYRIVIAEKGADLVGYAVTDAVEDSGAKVGHIVDLFAEASPEVLAVLVRRSVLDLLSRKVDYALCWMLPDKGAYRALRDIGFAPNEVAFPSVHIAFEIFDPEAVDTQVAGDARNWYLTMGDSDVY